MKNRLHLTNKEVQIDTIRFERTQIPFFNDVFTTLVIVVTCTDNFGCSNKFTLVYRALFSILRVDDYKPESDQYM